MLRTLPMTRHAPLTQRLVLIAFFTALTILSAQVKLYFGSPVPVTLQVLVVLLAGMVLGARDGALSQLFYISLIALNLPVDARMVGAAAFFSPTAGYLIGFIPAAFVTGWLIERSNRSTVQRWLAAVVGILVIYALGYLLLKLNTGLAWDAAWTAGVAPFIALDLGKALIAAAVAESGRAFFLRNR